MSVGASWWRTALAAGHAATALLDDDAPPELQHRRAVVCSGCDSLKGNQAVDLFGFQVAPRFATCGRLLRPEAGPKPTCGCLVLAESKSGSGLLIHGRPYEPAGKLTALHERCPQGHW